jgi:hypothetical protein
MNHKMLLFAFAVVFCGNMIVAEDVMVSDSALEETAAPAQEQTFIDITKCAHLQFTVTIDAEGAAPDERQAGFNLVVEKLQPALTSAIEELAVKTPNIRGTITLTGVDYDKDADAQKADDVVAVEAK